MFPMQEGDEQTDSRKHWATGLAAYIFSICFLIALYGGMIQFFHDWHVGAINPGMPDPDTWMRLAFLRKALEDGSILNYLFSRDGAPDGVELIWTLPMDLFETALASPFAVFYGWGRGLEMALPLQAVIQFLLVATSAMTLSRSVGFKHTLGWLCPILVISPAIIGYAHIGRATHHPLTLAISTFLLAYSIYFHRSPSKRNAAILAAFLCLGVWTSMETLPLIGISCFIVWNAAIQRGKSLLPHLFWLGSAIVGFGLVALAIDPPERGILVLATDRFSLFHLCALAVACLAWMCAAGFNRDTKNTRKLYSKALISTIPSLILLSVLFYFSHFPADISDPAVYNMLWYQDLENRPMFKVSGSTAFIMFPQPLGCLALIWLILKTPQASLKNWLYVLLAIFFVEVMLGIASIRLAGYSAVIGALAIAIAANKIIMSVFTKAPSWFAAVCLLATATGILIDNPYGNKTTPDLVEDCSLGNELAQNIEAKFQPEAIIAADIWLSPEFLWRTKTLRTIAGPYHTNVKGLHDLATAMSSIEDNESKEIFKKRGVSGILICKAPAHMSPVVFPPGSLQQRLGAGEIPPWLEDIPLKSANIRVFKVRN